MSAHSAPNMPRCGPAIIAGLSMTVPSTRSLLKARRGRRQDRLGTTALVTDGGWIVNGKKIFASLSGHADYYGALCTELATPDTRPSRANTMYLAIPRDAEGVSVEGERDPLGMRARCRGP